MPLISYSKGKENLPDNCKISITYDVAIGKPIDLTGYFSGREDKPPFIRVSGTGEPTDVFFTGKISRLSIVL